MKILALQLKRIGDAILTAPALAALREEFPLAQITYVVHGAAGELGAAFSAADHVRTYRPNRPNLRLWTGLVAGGWDLCLDFTGSDRSAVMARMSRAHAVVGYRKFVEKHAWRTHGYTRLCDASVRDRHTVDFHLALVAEALGKTVAPEDTGFLVPEIRKSAVSGLPVEPFVVVQPGSARAEKLWPAERWAEALSGVSQPIVLTGSAAADEQAHIGSIKAAMGAAAGRVIDLSGRLCLLQLARVLHDARLVLTVDSAAMHLAALAERPQIALFGPTNPFHWRPRHPAATILLAGAGRISEFSPRHTPAPMTDLPASTVAAAIAEKLATGPA